MVNWWDCMRGILPVSVQLSMCQHDHAIRGPNALTVGQHEQGIDLGLGQALAHIRPSGPNASRSSGAAAAAVSLLER
jgi:hypothetical protein